MENTPTNAATVAAQPQTAEYTVMAQVEFQVKATSADAAALFVENTMGWMFMDSQREGDDYLWTVTGASGRARRRSQQVDVREISTGTMADNEDQDD